MKFTHLSTVRKLGTYSIAVCKMAEANSKSLAQGLYQVVLNVPFEVAEINVPSANPSSPATVVG